MQLCVCACQSGVSALIDLECTDNYFPGLKRGGGGYQKGHQEAYAPLLPFPPLSDLQNKHCESLQGAQAQMLKSSKVGVQSRGWQCLARLPLLCSWAPGSVPSTWASWPPPRRGGIPRSKRRRKLPWPETTLQRSGPGTDRQVALFFRVRCGVLWLHVRKELGKTCGRTQRGSSAHK